MLVAECIVSDAEEGQVELMARRAEAVANAQSQLAAKTGDFARDQAEEYVYLAKEFVSATWVFQRN